MAQIPAERPCCRRRRSSAHQRDLYQPVYKDGAHACMHVCLHNAHVAGHRPPSPLHSHLQHVVKSTALMLLSINDIQHHLLMSDQLPVPKSNCSSMLYASTDVTTCENCQATAASQSVSAAHTSAATRCEHLCRVERGTLGAALHQECQWKRREPCAPLTGIGAP